MSQITMLVEGEVDISGPSFTPLNFFDGWRKLNGTATMKLITKIENNGKIIANYGIMAMVIRDTDILEILKQCDKIFLNYQTMIREPTNVYIQFIKYDGHKRQSQTLQLDERFDLLPSS